MPATRKPNPKSQKQISNDQVEPYVFPEKDYNYASKQENPIRNPKMVLRFLKNDQVEPYVFPDTLGESYGNPNIPSQFITNLTSSI
jgi:hypothetical protein